MALDLEGIRGIAARVAASYGLEIWDVELRGTGGKSRMLRVYIDRPRQVGAQPGGAVAASGGPGQEPGSPAVGGVTHPAVGGVTHPAVGGVTHEDCANVSRELGTILDVEDAVPGGTYLLEVSSPGLDRKLWRPGDFERFTGSRVKLMTREPVNANRHFEGRLLAAGEGKLKLGLEGPKEKGKRKKEKVEKQKAAGESPASTQVEIELSNVERANLVPEI